MALRVRVIIHVAAFDILELRLSGEGVASCNEVRPEIMFSAEVQVLGAELHILLAGMRITSMCNSICTSFLWQDVIF